jgi:copper chaperone
MAIISSSFTVIGMTCDHCVRAVRDELAALDGVTDVVVDLESGAVTVESTVELDRAAIEAAVDEAGYEVAT